MAGDFEFPLSLIRRAIAEGQMPRLMADRAGLAEALASFGEDGVAERVRGASDEEVFSALAAASKYYTSEEYALPSGTSMILDKALALGAVEALEGAPRELARKRRRPTRD